MTKCSECGGSRVHSPTKNWPTRLICVSCGRINVPETLPVADPDLRSRLAVALASWKRHRATLPQHVAERSTVRLADAMADILAAVTPPEPVHGEGLAGMSVDELPSDGHPLTPGKPCPGGGLCCDRPVFDRSMFPCSLVKVLMAEKAELERRCAPPDAVRAEAVEAADRALRSYADHGAWRPNDILVMSRELLRLARYRPAVTNQIGPDSAWNPES